MLHNPFLLPSTYNKKQKIHTCMQCITYDYTSYRMNNIIKIERLQKKKENCQLRACLFFNAKYHQLFFSSSYFFIFLLQNAFEFIYTTTNYMYLYVLYFYEPWWQYHDVMLNTQFLLLTFYFTSVPKTYLHRSRISTLLFYIFFLVVFSSSLKPYISLKFIHLSLNIYDRKKNCSFIPITLVKYKFQLQYVSSSMKIIIIIIFFPEWYDEKRWFEQRASICSKSTENIIYS